jgi:prepilin-type processing-associated H-X9-DG protein/prepilin-type N-terminal cleavage/methylation domain-containing protein
VKQRTGTSQDWVTSPVKRIIDGFSLVELLVVIAVITLLAGLLMPALGRAKQSARGIQCTSQMRQIGLAVRLYAEENDDLFPRSQHSAFTHGQFPWGRAIAGQVGQPLGSWTNLLNGLYRCPCDRRKTPWSYGQNVYFELDPASDDYTGSPQTWRRMAAVPLPSATIVHAENDTAADHIMPHFWQSAPDAAEVAQNRHRNKSNYSFVDGHAEALEFSKTFSPERQIDSWNPSLAR